MPNLIDKVAIITGSSSGIGAGTAVHFASLGCKLALTARNEAQLQSVAQKCIAAGLQSEHVLVIPGDVSDDAHAENVIQRTVDHFGKLDILINNAGIGAMTSVDAGTMADFDKVMKVNFRAAFYLIQLAAPHLKKTKGNVINVSSVLSERPFLKSIAYCSSKAAMDHMTRVVALELGPFQVRVNAVNPGVIDTGMATRVAKISEEEMAKIMNIQVEKHALGRIGSVDEVVKPIAFLASDDASFVTGSCFLVDGGMSLMM